MPNDDAMRKFGYMRKLRFTLPPPNLLVAFEAAGRLLSFTEAAREFNVTRVAISQQIKSLEEFLGVPLFRRLHRSLCLTSAGERYHGSVSEALRQIAIATDEIAKPIDRTVSVTTTTGFATFWLIPNIPEFRSRRPEIELRVIVSDRYLDLNAEQIDVAIRYGRPPFGNVDAEFLVQEEISPTCALSLRQQSQEISPADLLRLPLIHLDGPYHEQTRWDRWFQAQGLHWSKARSGMTVNSFTHLVQATLDGQGFALIGPPLINNFLRQGTLVQPVVAPTVLRQAFYVARPRGAPRSDDADAFCAWMRECFVAEAAPAAVR